MSIAIATAFSTDYLPGYVASEVNAHYADRHGYKFVCEILPVETMLAAIAPRDHCTWYKVHLFRRLFQVEPAFSHVVWIDADAVVVKPEIPLEEIISLGHDKDLIISEDLTACCKINCGVMILKNSDWTRRVWHEVWDNKRWHCSPFYEQATLCRWLDKHEPFFRQLVARPPTVRNKARPVQVLDHVSVLPQVVLNCNRGIFLNPHKRGSSKSKQAHKHDDEEPQFIFHAVGCSKLDAILASLEHFSQMIPATAHRFHHIFPRRLRESPKVRLGDARVIPILEDMITSQSCFDLLDIGNEELTDVVCPVLRSLLSKDWCHIKTLYLGGNEFAHEGLIQLALGVSSLELETLELNRCAIELAGLEAFARNLKLKNMNKLDLSDNPFSAGEMGSWVNYVNGLLQSQCVANQHVVGHSALGILDSLILEVLSLSPGQCRILVEPCHRVDRPPSTRQFRRTCQCLPQSCVVLV